VGAWGNLTPYYEPLPGVHLTMLMTGLGDTERDNILHVRVSKLQVKVESILLNGMTPQPLENFGPAYWEKVAAGELQP
jgi:hypothetical protein